MTPPSFWRAWRKPNVGVSDKLMAAFVTLALLTAALFVFLSASGH